MNKYELIVYLPSGKIATFVLYANNTDDVDLDFMLKAFRAYCTATGNRMPKLVEYVTVER